MNREEFLERMVQWRKMHGSVLELNEEAMFESVINGVTKRPAAAEELEELLANAGDLLGEGAKSEAELLVDLLKSS